MGHDSSDDYVELTGVDKKYYPVNWLSVAQMFSLLHNLLFVIIPLIGLFSDNAAMRRWWAIGIFGYVVVGGLFTFFWQGIAMYWYNSGRSHMMSEHHNSRLYWGFGWSWIILAINVAIIFTWLVNHGPPISGNLTTPVIDPAVFIAPASVRYQNLLEVVALLSLFAAYFQKTAIAAHMRPERKLEKMAD